MADTTRSSKVFEFAKKALSRLTKEIVDNENGEDELKLFILERTHASLVTVFQNKESCFSFVQMFLLPYWKDGKFNEEQLKKDSQAQLQNQIVEIIKENPDLAEKMENAEKIMDKAEKTTEFLYKYFAAMCDYATAQ